MKGLSCVSFCKWGTCNVDLNVPDSLFHLPQSCTQTTDAALSFQLHLCRIASHWFWWRFSPPTLIGPTSAIHTTIRPFTRPASDAANVSLIASFAGHEAAHRPSQCPSPLFLRFFCLLCLASSPCYLHEGKKCRVSVLHNRSPEQFSSMNGWRHVHPESVVLAENVK